MIDSSDPKFLENPFPTWARLRRTDPIHFSESLNAWVVTRYDDALAVLGDAKRFGATPPSGALRAGERPALRTFARLSARWLFFLDAPEHRPLRQLVDPACAAAALAALEPVVDREAQSAVARLTARGWSDAVTAFARPLAARVLAAWLVGKRSRSLGQVARACEQVAAASATPRAAHTRTAGVEALEWLAQFSLRRIRQGSAPRKYDIHDSLLDQLGGAAARSGRAAADAAAQALSVACAGHETVQDGLSGALLLLGRNPGEWARMRTDPARVLRVVDECLRLTSPVHALMRTALTRVTLRGRSIRAGQLVMVALGAANRDPERFVAPDRFDPGRAPGRLAFGHGPHVCPGAALARAELAATLRALTACAVEVDDARARWRTGNLLVRGLAALPLRVRYHTDGGSLECRSTNTSTSRTRASSAASSSGSSRSRTKS